LADPLPSDPTPAEALEAALTGVFGMPAFLLPWLDRFFESAELSLIAAMASGPLPTDGVLSELSDLTRADLDRAYKRGILDWRGADHAEVALADFHARYEVWAIFEGWKDVPDDVAEQVNQWELEAYAGSISADLLAVKEGRPAESGEAAYSYLLLPEAEELIAKQASVFLWPCNCRAMYRHCGKPVNVCLRFDNDRELGWEISTQRALELLREADRAGLMHTGYAGPGAPKAHGVCNCCVDCCFPHVAARRLAVADLWPTRRHKARVDAEACTVCGRCALRCPFGAFAVPRRELGIAGGDGGEVVVSLAGTAEGHSRDLVFTAAECRGCGLCATGCPESTIVMEALS
jgi:Pyruvate/2-oxoacid:ferredoxin oxidoreductase delta subunit